MDSVEVRRDAAFELSRPAAVDMKLEVIVLPVADADRAADFYAGLGWRVDADFKTEGGRLMQFTPPGSPCSIIFGTGATPAPPGSAQLMHLVVTDIEAANAELTAKGVKTSGVFHDAAGGYNHFDPAARASGPDPARRTYASFATFEDPDGNGWILQEITSRLPGRVDPSETRFGSTTDLIAALRRAAMAHGDHEARIGGPDANWPEWYAAYMVAEQAGAPLPT